MSARVPRFDKRRAYDPDEDPRSWTCSSCEKPIEVDEQGPHCWACRTYYEDVRSGLFDREEDWS
jgi:hypothetical protein